MPDFPRGVLLGAAIGDALAMPVDRLSHGHIRLYYRGIKGYEDDAHRGGRAGTGTARTAHLLACLGALASAPSRASHPAPPDGLGATAAAVAAATARAALGGATAPADDCTDDALPPVARLHARALRRLSARTDASGAFDPAGFCASLAADASALDADLGARLSAVLDRRSAVPLDLFDDAERAFLNADLPDAPGLAAWAFAVAMFARAPTLVEATLLSAINAGGEAATTGFALGGLLGALHGPDAFPADWRDGLAAGPDIDAASERP